MCDLLESEDRRVREHVVPAAGIDLADMDLPELRAEIPQNHLRFGHRSIDLQGVADIEAESNSKVAATGVRLC